MSLKQELKQSAKKAIDHAKSEIARVHSDFGDGSFVDLGLAKGWLAEAKAFNSDGLYKKARHAANNAFLICQQEEFPAEHELMPVFVYECVQTLRRAQADSESREHNEVLHVQLADGQSFVLEIKAKRSAGTLKV